MSAPHQIRLHPARVFGIILSLAVAAYFLVEAALGRPSSPAVWLMVAAAHFFNAGLLIFEKRKDA